MGGGAGNIHIIKGVLKTLGMAELQYLVKSDLGSLTHFNPALAPKIDEKLAVVFQRRNLHFFFFCKLFLCGTWGK